jgi:hypothetical protein
MPEADRQFRRIIGYAKLAVAIARQLDQTRAPPRPKGRYARHHIALTPGPPARRIHGDRDISIETQKVSPARDDQQEPAHSFRFLPQSAIAEVPRRLKSRAALAVVAPTCKSPEAQLAGRDARRAVAAGTAVAGDDIDAKRAEHDAERAQRYAENAEDDATFAVEYAYAAIEEAEYAVLDAALRGSTLTSCHHSLALPPERRVGLCAGVGTDLGRYEERTQKQRERTNPRGGRRACRFARSGAMSYRSVVGRRRASTPTHST